MRRGDQAWDFENLGFLYQVVGLNACTFCNPTCALVVSVGTGSLHVMEVEDLSGPARELADALLLEGRP